MRAFAVNWLTGKNFRGYESHLFYLTVVFVLALLIVAGLASMLDPPIPLAVWCVVCGFFLLMNLFLVPLVAVTVRQIFSRR